MPNIGRKELYMTKLIMGVLVTPDSYETDGLLGVWWPYASLTDTKDGKELEPVTHNAHESTKDRADAVALILAARRIRTGLHC
ncbi:hypothetical protein RP29_06045 [Acidovorax temperans]|uniref:Uncharacterized protein n=2 Tax=Acidovorax temperans TaxID=80878 RepID=A0A0D7KAH7_9BURK|nr:hypothetical protein RP29_06045 [Acidovorax temperans]